MLVHVTSCQIVLFLADTENWTSVLCGKNTVLASAWDALKSTRYWGE